MPVMSTTEIFRYGLRKVHFRPQTTDEKVLTSIFTDRKYDLLRLPQANELVSLLEHNRRRAGRVPLIVDAGANIGASAVYFLDKMPDGWVIAIEPEEANFALLERNVEGLQVKPMKAALSNAQGRAMVVDPKRGNWAYRAQSADEAESGASVPFVTMSDLYANAPKETFPFLVKIDIEGGEKELFSGDTEWVSQTPVIIIELHDWMLPKQGTAQPFLQCISRLDRDFIQWDENIYSIAHRIDAFRVPG
jgi:FkbM family methyltransferase